MVRVVGGRGAFDREVPGRQGTPWAMAGWDEYVLSPYEDPEDPGGSSRSGSNVPPPPQDLGCSGADPQGLDNFHH